jgi:hypothetical protein
VYAADQQRFLYQPDRRFEAPIVPGQPADGCAPLANGLMIKESAAYVILKRGTCSFVQQAKNAQSAGASGLIVQNDRTQIPSKDSDPCEYAEDGTCDVPAHCPTGDFEDCRVVPEVWQMGGVFSNINIPVMMVTKLVGDLLFQEMNPAGGKNGVPTRTPSIVLTTGAFLCNCAIPSRWCLAPSVPNVLRIRRCTTAVQCGRCVAGEKHRECEHTEPHEPFFLAWEAERHVQALDKVLRMHRLHTGDGWGSLRLGMRSRRAARCSET